MPKELTWILDSILQSYQVLTIGPGKLAVHDKELAAINEGGCVFTSLSLIGHVQIIRRDTWTADYYEEEEGTFEDLGTYTGKASAFCSLIAHYMKKEAD